MQMIASAATDRMPDDLASARRSASSARLRSVMSRVTVPMPMTARVSGSRIRKWVSDTGIDACVCQLRNDVSPSQWPFAIISLTITSDANAR